jgi:hypothetical protein
MFFHQLTHQAFLVMLRHINPVVKKKDLEKHQNVLKKHLSLDAQRNVGGRSGKKLYFYK